MQVQTVGELIKELQKCPPDTRLIGWDGNDYRSVVVYKNDYEDVDAGEKLSLTVIIINVSH